MAGDDHIEIESVSFSVLHEGEIGELDPCGLMGLSIAVTVFFLSVGMGPDSSTSAITSG